MFLATWSLFSFDNALRSIIFQFPAPLSAPEAKGCVSGCVLASQRAIGKASLATS